MGTNYYLHENSCPSCHRSDEPLHIGKSSAGWCFALHVMPEDGICDLDDWEERWRMGGEIRNEYGEAVSLEDMRAVILARASDEPWGKTPFGYSSWEEFHEVNFSERGPVGLLRHAINQRSRCIGHGCGTYDLIVGEFS